MLPLHIQELVPPLFHLLVNGLLVKIHILCKLIIGFPIFEELTLIIFYHFFLLTLQILVFFNKHSLLPLHCRGLLIYASLQIFQSLSFLFIFNVSPFFLLGDSSHFFLHISLQVFSLLLDPFIIPPDCIF